MDIVVKVYISSLGGLNLLSNGKDQVCLVTESLSGLPRMSLTVETNAIIVDQVIFMYNKFTNKSYTIACILEFNFSKFNFIIYNINITSLILYGQH